MAGALRFETLRQRLPPRLGPAALVLFAPLTRCAPSFDDGTFAPDPARCTAALAPHDVQGSSAASPLAGETVDVGGVVTLAAAGAQGPGFFIQSLSADDDPETSEGLFVAWSGAAPGAGTRLRVRGEVIESAGRTELARVERLDACGAAATLPAPLAADRLEPGEPWESMWVRAHAGWTLVDTAELLRSGRVTVSARGRLFASGHVLGAFSAGAPLWTIEAAGVDARAAWPARAAPRLGAQLDELIGVVELDAPGPRLLVAAPPPWPDEPPEAPPRARSERLRVVALNLDNYFVDLAGRGARSPPELARQRDKLAAALLALDADVLALTELGDASGQGRADSLADLMAALDVRLEPARRYAFSAAAAPGGSPLRAGIAHRPERVRADAELRFDGREGFRRPPLFQSFERHGARLTLGVVHFTSKRCGDEPVLVPDDGCGSAERAREAELLLASVRELSAGAGAVLVMGDFNADALEPPLRSLGRAGFFDLLDELPAEQRYSFVFERRASLLDHALWAPGAALPAHSAALWHIDADEPGVRGYSLDNPPEQYRADARRCSDHDPVIVDLEL